MSGHCQPILETRFGKPVTSSLSLSPWKRIRNLRPWLNTSIEARYQGSDVPQAPTHGLTASVKMMVGAKRIASNRPLGSMRQGLTQRP